VSISKLFFHNFKLEVYEHHTVYKVYYHTARNAGTFATEQMFYLHWQVTDLEEIRSINICLFQLSTLLFVVLVASIGEKVRVIETFQRKPSSMVIACSSFQERRYLAVGFYGLLEYG